MPWPPDMTDRADVTPLSPTEKSLVLAVGSLITAVERLCDAVESRVGDRDELDFARDAAALANKAMGWPPDMTTPVQAAERVRDALRAANSAFDDMDLMAASYCELCEAHAPKHDDGSLAGPVAHKADCAVGKVRAARAQADALVEVVRAAEAVLALRGRPEPDPAERTKWDSAVLAFDAALAALPTPKES